MQLVVCDTSILFPGLVSENGIYRKLLVVFAWSKLHMYLRAAEEEHAEVQRLLEAHPGATLGGNYDPAARVQRAKERIAVLEEHLPAMTPTDFGLVISSPITKELEDNMAGVRSRIGNLDPETIQANIAAAVSIASRHVIDGFDGPIPDYAEGRDPKDDPVIHTAVLAKADWILTKDTQHISLNWKRPTIYTDPVTGSTHQAVGMNYFIGEVLCSGYHFDDTDFRSIDGELLSLALQS